MSGFVDNAKGLISIVRDGLITLILIFLLAVPSFVNNRLKGAGFVKASIAGFDWQSTVEDNNDKLVQAAKTIDSLQAQLGTTQNALKDSETSREALAQQVKATMPNSAAAETASAPPPANTGQIIQQNSQVLKSSEIKGSILLDQIKANRELLATVQQRQ
jgi:hypothetical protein